MIGSLKIKSEWIPFAEPVVVKETFNASMAFSGEKGYVLSDKKLKEFSFDGTKATFSKDIPLDDEYENMQLGSDGTLYLSAFMKDLIGIKDGEKVFAFEGTKNVAMHPSGEWGISFFPGNVPDKVTIKDGVMKMSPLGGDVVKNASDAFVTENHIFLWGTPKDKEKPVLVVFGADGKFKFNLGNTEGGYSGPEALGWVSSVVETENGFFVLDGNMNSIVLWNTKGEFIGGVDVEELFKTDSPKLSSALRMPDGNIMVGVFQDRADGTTEEMLLYKVSGF